MKKLFNYLFKALLVGVIGSAVAQSYKNDLKSSSITFYSKAALEDIEGTSSDFIALINTANDSVLVRIPNNSFKFESALMEEHYNENYIESHKYKFTFFVGKLTSHFDPSKEGIQTTSVTGVLDLHGVKQNRTFEVVFAVKSGVITANSEMALKLDDHNITIPKIVFQKIAEVITIKLKANFIRFK